MRPRGRRIGIQAEGGASLELELAFLLAATTVHRQEASGRIVDLAHRADPRTLVAVLERRRLLPLLGRRLIEVTDHQLADEFIKAVASAHARDRARAMKVEVATSRALTILAGAGVRALVLKGPALAEEAHGDIGLRAPMDVDLLVETRSLPAAVDALRREGFHAPRDRVDDDGLPQLHFALGHPELPAVELHWRIHWYERDFSADMLHRSASDDQERLRPDPADMAGALLLFFARDGFYGLRLAVDVAGWWERQGASLGTGVLDAHVSRYAELRRIWQAAGLAAARYVGVPLTFWFTDPLPPDRHRDLALRLGNWSQLGDADQLAANVALVDGLLGPPGSVGQFVRRVPLAAPGAPWAHCVKTALRFVAALWRIRKRSWVVLPRRHDRQVAPR